MKSLLAIALCLIATTALADDPRMRDNSLSPEETAREPDIKYSHDPFQPAGMPGVGGTGNSYSAGQGGLNNQAAFPISSASSKFMNTFCDPNFKAGVAMSGATQSCLASSRKQACDRFNALPADAKSTLDHMIGCAMAGQSGEDAPATGLNCVDNDDNGRVLILVKKYYQDQDTLYSLIFLPDIVLGTNTNCIGVR